MKTLIWLFLLLLQLNQPQLTVTLLDADKQPIREEELTFKNEQNEILASCLTNSDGRCTMTLPSPDGELTRGTLLTKFGRRPIIFRGESLEITLELNTAGSFEVPSDTYVTRTPEEPTGEPTGAAKEPTEAAKEPTGAAKEPTGEPTQEEVTSPTQEEVTSPTQEEVDTEKPLEPEEHETPIEVLIFRGFFIFLLVCTLIFYIWKTKQ